jgi:hypothetical protein
MFSTMMLRVCALVALALAPGSAFAAQPSGQPIDGIPCQSAEGVLFHTHQHLAIYDHGKPVEVPAGVGIIPGKCLYWLHTHTPNGLIHVESFKYRDFTLGEFFDVWGESLTRTSVVSARVGRGQMRVYVGGHPYDGDPRKLLLAYHADFVIEAGPPYFKPKPFTSWMGN